MKSTLFTVVLVFSTAMGLSAQSSNGQGGLSTQPVSPIPSQPANPVAQATATIAEPISTTPTTAKIAPDSKVYITPMDGFENYLAAAFGKKKVQLVIVGDPNLAQYVITGTSIDKKAGWAKMVFMGDIHSDNAASVTVTDRKTGVIVYAYAVDKKSTLHGQQTSAEACAKHLEAHIEGKE